MTTSLTKTKKKKNKFWGTLCARQFFQTSPCDPTAQCARQFCWHYSVHAKPVLSAARFAAAAQSSEHVAELVPAQFS